MVGDFGHCSGIVIQIAGILAGGPYGAVIVAAKILAITEAAAGLALAADEVVALCFVSAVPSVVISDLPSDFPTLVPSTMMPTMAPTLAPSPGPTPAPNEPDEPGNGDGASSSGDPHIYSFDGCYYDCQGVGEFTLMKTLNATVEFELQARYTRFNTIRRQTVTTAIAVAADGAPSIQLSQPSDANDPMASIVGSCPDLFYVNGSIRNVTSGTDSSSISITVNDDSVFFNWDDTGIQLRVRSRKSFNFGCFLSVFVSVPRSFSNVNKVIGLLGSPNGDSSDDWMDPSGQPIPFARDNLGYLFQPAYDYCTTNWCVRDEAKSLFVYDTGKGFSDFFSCDRQYAADIDLGAVPDDFAQLCGNDYACLIDGLAGGIQDARNVLEDEDLLEQLRPATLVGDTLILDGIELQMNYDGWSTSLLKTATAFLGGVVGVSCAEEESDPNLSFERNDEEDFVSVFLGQARMDGSWSTDNAVVSLRSQAAGDEFESGPASINVFFYDYLNLSSLRDPGDGSFLKFEMEYNPGPPPADDGCAVATVANMIITVESDRVTIELARR